MVYRKLGEKFSQYEKNSSFLLYIVKKKETDINITEYYIIYSEYTSDAGRFHALEISGLLAAFTPGDKHIKAERNLA